MSIYGLTRNKILMYAATKLLLQQRQALSRPTPHATVVRDDGCRRFALLPPLAPLLVGTSWSRLQRGNGDGGNADFEEHESDGLVCF
jgi:hypothetical protein